MMLSAERARSIHEQAAVAFQPRTPISNREFFAGRWEQLTQINDAVSHAGLHVIIYGERGVGKTSIANVIKPLVHMFDGDRSERDQAAPDRLVIKVNANVDDSFSDIWIKAFGEVGLSASKESIGFIPEQKMIPGTLADRVSASSDLTIDDVRRVLTHLPESVFVFDEFDRMGSVHVKKFTDLIKSLSDYAVPTTIVLVGVAETVDELIADHQSVERAMIQVPMPRMTADELAEILVKAEEILGIQFAENAKHRVVKMSQGLPHYAHLVGQNAVRKAAAHHDEIVSTQHVDEGLLQAMRSATQSVKTSYETATHSAHPDALYTQVLLACALAAYDQIDNYGFFQASSVVDPLGQILNKTVTISTFNKHLAEFSEVDSRGRILEKRGKQRSYRYRFRNPLLPPYIIMKGISGGLISADVIR